MRRPGHSGLLGQSGHARYFVSVRPPLGGKPWTVSVHFPLCKKHSIRDSCIYFTSAVLDRGSSFYRLCNFSSYMFMEMEVSTGNNRVKTNNRNWKYTGKPTNSCITEFFPRQLNWLIGFNCKDLSPGHCSRGIVSRA